MLPRVQPYQNSSGGDTNSGLFEDIGTRSLQTVRVGEGAGKTSTGSANTFVGYEAGKINSAGSYDTFVGYQAGSLNQAGNYSTMIGAFAGRANQRGSECVMIGYRAGELNNDGQSFVAVGAYAMRENVSGLGSVAIGWRAAERNLDGDYNTLIGAECAQDNRSGNMNTMCGFRSGRANSRGNENTYVGAYSGYSNRDGSANALIGYKCGENMAFGSLNVAIGAYALQNATYASCNVVIGPYAGANTTAGSDCVIIGKNAGTFTTHGSENVILGTNAGESNMNNQNVIVGYNAGKDSEATATVIIGTNAGKTAGGQNSVIIGYEAASSFIHGDCNVFVGYGADAYQPSLSYGIAIGTYNTYTNEHAISIGEEIYNQRAYSILMGFGIQSDANNSVLMGNNINIQSVIFFKDPLNYLLRNTVANDAFTKLGIDNIKYGFSNQLLVAPPPQNTIYNYAIAGLITSNIQNSTTNRLSKNVSPESLDLRLAMTPLHSAIVQGETITIRNSSEQYSQKERFYWEFYGFGSSYNNPAVSPLQSHSNIVLSMSDFVLNHSCNLAVNFPSGVVAKNIRYYHEPYITNADLELYVAKRVKYPILSFTQCNISFSQTFLDSPGLTKSLFTFDSNMILWDSQGIEGSNLGFVTLAVERPPVHVKLDKGAYNIGDTVSCILFRDQTYASHDSFLVRPILQIIDNDSYQYGRPGPVVEIILDFHGATSNTELYKSTIYNCSNTAITSTDIFRIPIAYSPSDSVFISNISSSNALLSYSNVAYSSNDLAVMYQEDVFTTFSYSNFGSNVNATFELIEPIRTDNINYYAYTLSPSVQSFVDYGVQSNLFGFPSLANDAQQLINISSCNITFETFPNRYIEFTCNINNWAIIYDIVMTSSNQDTNITSNVISDVYLNASNIQQAYATYPWDLVSTSLHAISSNILASSNSQSVLSNIISITSNLLSNTYPFQSLQTLSEKLDYIDYKYFRLKRFPDFSYNDIIHSRIRLTCEETTQAAFTLIVADSDIYDISTRAAGHPVIWDTVPFTSVNSNVYNTSVIQFPSIQCDNLIPIQYPVNGIYDSQQITYRSFNPFASNDCIKFVATSNSLSESVQWSLNYNFTKTEQIIYASMYKYGLEDQLNITNVFRSQSSNVIPLWDTYTITETDKVSGYTSNYTYRVSLENAYDPAIGYSEITSNVSTSNTDWIVTPASDSNTGISYLTNRYRYEYNVTDYNGDYFPSSPINSEYVIFVGSNNTAFDSNIVHTTEVTESVIRKKAYNISIDLIDSDQETWKYFSAHNSNYYLYTSNTPVSYRDPTSNVIIQTISTPANTSNAYNIRHKYIAYSNLVVYEPLYFLHRNAVFSYNGHYTCSSNYFVASNIGPIGSFTQQDIDKGLIGMRLSRIPNNAVVGIGQSNVIIRNFEASNIVVNGSNIVYDASSVLISGPYTSIPIVFNPSRYDLPPEFIPEYVHILNVERGYFSSGLKSDIADVYNYIYTSTSNYDSDIITFMYSSNNVATSPIKCKITFLRYPYYDRQYFNIGATTNDTSVLSYDAFNWKDGSDTITITSAPDPAVATISSSSMTFTISDVIAGNVKVSFSSNAPATIIYNTQSTTNNIYQLIPYHHYAFPRSYGGEKITLYQYANDNTGIHNNIDTVFSPLWSFVTHMKLQGVSVDPHDVTVEILDEISSGFIWNITSRRECIKSFPLYHLLNDHIHFIPYNPSYAPNITVRVVVLYSDVVSPIYTVTIENLYSRFQNSATSSTTRVRPYLQNVATSSAGFLSKGLSWSPSSFAIPFIGSNIPTVFNFPINLVNNGIIQESYTYGKYLYASSEEMSWKQNTSSLYLSLDQADSVSLKPILDSINVATYSNIQNVYLYITQRPVNGIIQNTSNVLAEAAIRFSDYDLLDGRILYQHFGSDTVSDVFKVALSTTPYDLASNEITVNVNIKPIPHVTKNMTTYVYYDSVASALSTPNLFAPCNIVVSSTNDTTSYVHFINKNGVEVRNIRYPNLTVDTTTVANFTSTAFNISSIPAQSAQPYPRMGMDIICNNRSNTGSYNYLIDYHPAYTKLLKYQFDVYLNHYVSSNIITNSNQYRYQTLQYDFNPINAGYSNLTNHVFTYFIQVQPHQDLLPSQFQNPNGSELLRTFGFTLHFEDSLGQSLLNMYFNHNGVTISTSNITGFYPYNQTNKIVFGQWNNILFINDDTDNNRHASLYIGYNNTVSKQFNIPKNLLLNSDIGRISFNRLSNIRVSVDIEDPINYVSGASSNFVVSGVLSRSFNLSCYGTSLYIRNQEIYTSTYSLDDPNVDVQSTNVHNVVVGKNIIVRGTNNICMGNKFNTSGQYSIVIGNEIGTGDEQGQINELYQCIIIGNQSFANSISRDIISIGNNNFNSLNSLPQEVINSFLSTKPIILGNDISESSIDFTINVGDVFLKTILGGDQIYLGKNEEPVGIGFTSNSYLQPDYKMHVNGSAAMGKLTTPYLSSNNAYIPPHYPVIYCDDENGKVALATSFQETCVIGICDSCLQDVTTGLYNVFVQHTGVANVVVDSVSKGDFIYTSNSGLCASSGSNRYNYTIGKALRTGSNIIPCVLTI